MKRLITILLYSILFTMCNVLLIAQVPPSTAHNYIPQSFDVLHYDVTIDMTAIPEQDVHGISTILVRWTDDAMPKKFYFHALGIKPDSLYVNSEKWTYSKEIDAEDCVYYAMPQPENTGDIDTIQIYYSGTLMSESGDFPFGGINYQDSVLYNLGVGFTTPEVSAARYWFPCYDHPSDKASFRCSYIVPDTLVVAGNGLLEDILYADNHTNTYIWNMKSEAATYLMNFAVAKWHTLNFGEDENCPIVVYAQERDTAKCRFVFSRVPEMKQCHEHYFGAYPFEKIGYVLTEYGSMEHQTMISFARAVMNRAYSRKDDRETTIFHELTHHWFGDWLTTKDFRDTWLNEAFAEYSEALWLEYSGEPEEYFTKLFSEKLRYLPSTALSEQNCPLYDFDASVVGNYPNTIYSKAALVLGMLRYEIGDEIFFDWIKKYVQHFKNGILSTQDFMDFYHETVGTEQDWFFDQWVFGRGYPQLDVEKYAYIDEATGTTMISGMRITQVQDEEFGVFINVPLEITGYDIDNNPHTFVIRLSEKETHLDLLDSNFVKKQFTTDSYNTIVPCLRVSKSVTTGILEETGNDIAIYPNPTSDYLYAQFHLAQETTLSVVNSLGTILYQETLFGKDNAKIDLRNLPIGTYFLHSQVNGKSTVSPFAVIR